MFERVLRPGRLVGIDLARTLALVGMIATHVLDSFTATGERTFVQDLAGGRASALFAVLAGVSMALMSGGAHPLRGSERWRTTWGLAARAVLIALIGLALGALDTSLAIILAYYGVLFLLGLPFLALRARTLVMLAAGWVIAAPVLSHLIRPELPARTLGSPEFARLSEPGPLLADLLFTGYYPAVPWLAYLLAGMALGRLDLSGRTVPVRLVGIGAVLVVAATVVSRAWTADVGVRQALFMRNVDRDAAARYLGNSQHGSTPTGGAWEWLLVAAPHSATPLDLAQTIGSALIAIGLSLLLVHVLARPGRVGVALLAGAGAMPLTLYSLHVAMRTPQVWPAEEPGTFGIHVVVVLGVGAVFALAAWRGPLEWLVGWPGRALRRERAIEWRGRCP